MSRSRRRTPIWGMCGPRASEKTDKKLWHGRLRAAERAVISRTADLDRPAPHIREVSDPWGMKKDGKRYRVGSSWHARWSGGASSSPWVIRMMRK